MTKRTLFHLCALALVSGGILGPVGHWLEPPGRSAESVASPLWIPSHMSVWLSALLLAIGAVGLYARIAHRAGAWGVVAFLLLFLSQANMMTLMMMEALSYPSRALTAVQNMPGWAVLLMVPPRTLGPILFGLLLVRAGRPWRTAGAVIIGAEILSIALFASGQSVWALRLGNTFEELSLGWAGLMLWREGSVESRARTGEAQA